MFMKIGFAEWGMRDIPFMDHFSFTRKMGVSFLEISAGGANGTYRLSVPTVESELKKVAELKKQYKIDTTFGAIGGGFDLEDEKIVWNLIEEQKGALDVLALAETKVVRIFAGWEPVETLKESQYRNMMDALIELDRYAGEKGMRLAIETHGTLRRRGSGEDHLHNVSTDWGMLNRLLQNLPPHTGFLFDTGNLRAVTDGERSLVDYVSLLNDVMIAVHVKDWTQNPDRSWRTIAIGETEYDWKPIFDAMKFDGVALIEYEDPITLETGMASSIRYLQSIGLTF